MKDLCIVILAGGLGKRMNSDIPKVLHCLQNKPMLVHVIEKAKALSPKRIFVVVGKYKDIIEKTLKTYINMNQIEFVEQQEALGTGHALQCCKDVLTPYNDSYTLVLCGDVPLIQEDTMKNMCSDVSLCKLLGTYMKNPYGYGRIKTDNQGQFEKIVEQKDCNDQEEKLTLINAGVYAFDTNTLCDFVMKLKNDNANNEYYLTDVPELIQINNPKTVTLHTIPPEDQLQLTGVNTKEDLDALHKIIST